MFRKRGLNLDEQAAEACETHVNAAADLDLAPQSLTHVIREET